MNQKNSITLVYQLARTNPEYQTALARANALEPGFLRLRESLSDEERTILDAYLSACEDMDHALLRIACSMPGLIP